MIVREVLLAEDLAESYRSGAADPDFREILDRLRPTDDAELADLIEADGRARLRFKRPVTLNRYLDAVPGLARRSDALDAAIDMALRGMARSGRADADSVEKLVIEHPSLGRAIRDAAALSNTLWSTQRVRKLVDQAPPKELPCEFGPVLEDGRRRYVLRELLGEGAFGQVYLAVDRQLGEEDHPAFVSVKLLASGDGSRWRRQHLIDEAAKARRIIHPNVVRVLDRGVSDRNEDFLVYEYVEGGDLARWARRHAGGVPVEAAARIVAKVARGVHAAHIAGLVHCDLKPNNVVLTADGEVKVADFGAAIRSDDREAARQRDAGAAAPVGNLAFMSPEQFRMEPGALTTPTDVYALGGILYWLLTGDLPNGGTPEAIERTHDPVGGRAEPPSVRDRRPRVDRDLDAICRRAMAVRPQDRFGSAAELAANLEAWLRKEPIAWTRPSIARRTRLWVRRKPALAAAVAVVGVIVVASGATLQHFRAVAQQKRLEVAIAEAELDKEEEMRDSFRSKMRRMLAYIGDLKTKGLQHEVLPVIWISEWVFGTEFFGEGPDRLALWEARKETVRDLIAKSRARGGDEAFLTLMWESALGYWLVLDGEYDEAEPLLAENYSGWAAILDPADPWLVHLRGLRACVEVDRLAEAGGGDLERMEALAETLLEAERMLDQDEYGGPLHYLVVTHLERLCAPDMLHRPGARADLAAKLLDVTD